MVLIRKSLKFKINISILFALFADSKQCIHTNIKKECLLLI